VASVSSKEQQAEKIAHILDDVIRIPGTTIRIGADPLVGLVPVVGDAIAALGGTAILVIARQLNLSWLAVSRMAYNQLKNGLIGAIPFLGDLYSMGFKSNAINAALLLRMVKAGAEGSCPLEATPLKAADLLILALLEIPIIGMVLLVSLWFWEQNISYVSILFPPAYHSR
jgi:hypothetical protein